jgi:ABC-type lipoprotein release transport system permease subunit
MEKAGDELHRRLRAAVHAVLYPLLAGVLALVGVVAVASGFADYLQSRIAVAGAGHMIVGAILVAVALAALFVHYRAGRN